ncbi:MAG: ABC transporter ATP-binding protein [Anaerolineae bacterium]|nr:ABC transporter ATP-binding protein [Anaerolineae bacterium]
MPSVQMTGITKYFPGVVANDSVDFDVRAGEIHALVGENGAGKSTLMKILYGMQRPDAGQITLDGQPVTIPNPQAAIRLGIDMVHQHFQLVPSLTVAENVALGHEPRRGGLFVDRAAMHARVHELSERYGLRVDPAATVRDLSVGVQQRVEILKLLYREARLLILDEPSAVLTPQEVEDLFDVLRRLVEAGRTAIFITHKLREVMAICDRATVLRGGRVVGSVTVSDTEPETIAAMMVGRSVEAVRRAAAEVPTDAEPSLQVRDLHVRDDRGLPAVRGMTFEVRVGEIVGLAGVEGNGQRELIEALVGLRNPTEGAINLRYDEITTWSHRRRRALGMAIIPEDRTHEGLSPDSTLMDNLTATRYHEAPLSVGGVLRVGRMRDAAQRAIDAFDIRVRGPQVRVRTLSGGNAQKVVLARELAETPAVLIAAQPTRGLDVGATQFVHSELLRLRAAGTGILLVSADLDELLALADRLVVVFEGQLVGQLGADDATRERLGLLMAGRPDQVTWA